MLWLHLGEKVILKGEKQLLNKTTFTVDCYICFSAFFCISFILVFVGQPRASGMNYIMFLLIHKHETVIYSFQVFAV